MDCNSAEQTRQVNSYCELQICLQICLVGMNLVKNYCKKSTIQSRASHDVSYSYLTDVHADSEPYEILIKKYFTPTVLCFPTHTLLLILCPSSPALFPTSHHCKTGYWVPLPLHFYTTVAPVTPPQHTTQEYNRALTSFE